MATWFKEATASNAVISATLLTVRVLHTVTRLGIEDFKACNSWISGFTKQHSVMYKTVSGICKSVDSSTVEEWRKEQVLKIINNYKLNNIYIADETGLSSGSHLTGH